MSDRKTVPAAGNWGDIVGYSRAVRVGQTIHVAGNTAPGDGCAANCKPEPGYTCAGDPSKCNTLCGDGVVVAGLEVCDDGNTNNGDGCNAVCKVEPGFTCSSGSPTVCKTICGDGYAAGDETCDVGPPKPNDGCDDSCHAEHGYVCNNFPSVCATVCGDGVVGGTEQCDDGNNVGGDGCSANCNVIQGYTCAGEPSKCTTICGDSIQAGAEQCDDGNNVNGDCCSTTCSAEPGCEIETNDAISMANDFAALAMNATVKGTIKPATDIDTYLVTIPAGQTAVLTAATLDGFNSSCVNLTQDSVVTVYDNNGSVLGTDDNSGPGNCALLQLVNLPGGDYYVEVKAKTSTPFSYALNVQVQIVICGDGVKSPGEQCDDSNTANGDGCSSTCQIEVVNEIEPNNTPAQALTNGPFPVNQIWAGAISPVADNDYYLIQLSTFADLRTETFDGGGVGSCASIDTKIYLYAANGTTQLDSDDDSGVGSCSLMDSTVAANAGSRHLAPGNYYIRVQRYNDTVVIPAYQMLVTFNAVCGNGIVEGSEQCDGNGGAPCDANCNRVPVCGDGLVDAPEQCDDNNNVNGDGCSSTCQLEGVYSEVEPNNTFAQATSSTLQLNADAKIVGSIGAVGDKDYYAFTLATATTVRFETFQGSNLDCTTIATKINLYNSAQTLVNSDTTDGISSCSALITFLPAGSYFVEVEQSGNTSLIPTYLLEIKLEANLGNEVEPNDTQATATPLAGADVYIYGDHQLGTDVDYFAVTVPAGKSIRAEVIEGDLTETCESNGIDSYMRLFNAAATSLAVDDDSGRGFCSLIDGTGSAPSFAGAHNLTAGTYYLQVAKSSLASATGAVFNYRLAVTVR